MFELAFWGTIGVFVALLVIGLSPLLLVGAVILLAIFVTIAIGVQIPVWVWVVVFVLWIISATNKQCERDRVEKITYESKIMGAPYEKYRKDVGGAILRKTMLDFVSMDKNNTLSDEQICGMMDRLCISSKHARAKKAPYEYLIYFSQARLLFCAREYYKSQILLQRSLRLHGNSWEGAELLGEKLAEKHPSEDRGTAPKAAKITVYVAIGVLVTSVALLVLLKVIGKLG